RAQAAGNITLHPPTNDMRPLYSRARLLLAPSQWREAWGRVATEAQVNGIPVLASARGGLPESVGPGGLLVEHDAPLEAWLAAFSEIWDDPVRYERYSTEAKRHSLRPEIQPDQIVREFITEDRAFSNTGAQSPRGAPERGYCSPQSGLTSRRVAGAWNAPPTNCVAVWFAAGSRSPSCATSTTTDRCWC